MIMLPYAPLPNLHLHSWTFSFLSWALIQQLIIGTQTSCWSAFMMFDKASSLIFIVVSYQETINTGCNLTFIIHWKLNFSPFLYCDYEAWTLIFNQKPNTTKEILPSCQINVLFLHFLVSFTRKQLLKSDFSNITPDCMPEECRQKYLEEIFSL